MLKLITYVALMHHINPIWSSQAATKKYHTGQPVLMMRVMLMEYVNGETPGKSTQWSLNGHEGLTLNKG